MKSFTFLTHSDHFILCRYGTLWWFVLCYLYLFRFTTPEMRKMRKWGRGCAAVMRGCVGPPPLSTWIPHLSRSASLSFQIHLSPPPRGTTSTLCSSHQSMTEKTVMWLVMWQQQTNSSPLRYRQKEGSALPLSLSLSPSLSLSLSLSLRPCGSAGETQEMERQRER